MLRIKRLFCFHIGYDRNSLIARFTASFSRQIISGHLDDLFSVIKPKRIANRCQHLGRYEEAVAQIKKSLDLSPNSTSSLHAHLIFTYAEMGREDLARATAAKLLTINPKFSAEKYTKALPYKDRDYSRRWGEALRKAGLK
jgi:tetratricopeptide (TPR) repeat protein